MVPLKLTRLAPGGCARCFGAQNVAMGLPDSTYLLICWRFGAMPKNHSFLKPCKRAKKSNHGAPNGRKSGSIWRRRVPTNEMKHRRSYKAKRLSHKPRGLKAQRTLYTYLSTRWFSSDSIRFFDSQRSQPAASRTSSNWVESSNLRILIWYNYI